jgi:O-antigen ligase
LPFGSAAPAALAAWCIVLGAALALASPAGLRRQQWLPLLVAALVVIAYGGVLAVQMESPAALAVARHAIWREAGALLGHDLPPSIAIARGQPPLSIGAPLVAVLSFATAFIVCADRARAYQLMRVFVWSSFAYGVVSGALFVIDPTKVLWQQKIIYESSLTGPFMGRNTAAVYFGSGATVCFLLLQQELRSYRHRHEKRRLRDLFDPAASGDEAIRHTRAVLARWAFVFAVLVAALFLTGSRAGVVFSLIGLVVGTIALRWRSLVRGRRLLFVGLAAAIVIVVALQIFGGHVGERFDASGLTDSGRFETYRSTLRIIADHPLFGTGLGTFPYSYPAYRSPDISIWGIWTRTHDTLLEIASEGGLPLAAFVAAVWTAALVALLLGIRARRRGLVVPVAAFAVATIALLHALIDFSLQIPGYSIAVLALVGAGLAQSYRRHEAVADLR